MGDGFYRSKDTTNSIKVLKEKKINMPSIGCIVGFHFLLVIITQPNTLLTDIHTKHRSVRKK